MNGDSGAAEVPIPEPQLWWPNGYGDQPLYLAEVALYQEDTLLDSRTYQLGLRTLALRQDPDIILVGEMRDLETISLALTAAETGHLVFGTLHTNSAVGAVTRLRDMGVLPWAEKAMADGRIGHLGFSFHDEYELFQQIIDDYDGWTMCQIQYNYMDVEQQAGRRGLEYAAEKGLAVVVMEPIRGGRLSNKVPPSVQAIWDSAPLQRSPAEWALQWVWSQPEVTVALSGMSTMQHVQENVASAERSAPNLLTEGEEALVARVRVAYEDLCPIPCTDCKYCLPCPEGIEIGWVIWDLDQIPARGIEQVKEWYAGFPVKASACVECGVCIERCPFEVDIIAKVREAAAVFETTVV